MIALYANVLNIFINYIIIGMNIHHDVSISFVIEYR